MGWRSSVEIGAEFLELPAADKYKIAFCLSVLASRARYPVGFRTSDAWASAIVPTDSGAKLLGLTDDSPAARFALFGYFFHHDPVIDYEKSDLELIRTLLNQGLLDGGILLPNIWGRELYDKFNDDFSTNRTDHLDPPEVERLLDDEPVGIYCLGRFVTGPLGVLESDEVRWLPPSEAAPLWHCSDTGCSRLHKVTLHSGDCDVVSAYEAISRSALKANGPQSEWFRPSVRLLRPPRKKPAEYAFADMVEFMAGCIVGKDRSEMLRAALSGDQRHLLRERISESPRGKELEALDAGSITSRLSAPEQLQLLALLNNQNVSLLLDTLVQGRRIIVHPEEMRRAPIAFSRDERRHFPTELSSRGTRSTGPRPLIRLSRLIRDAYAQSNREDDLRWRLNAVEGITTTAALRDFLHRQGPRDAISRLVVSERQVFDEIASTVHLNRPQVELGDDTEECLLWKCGFNAPRYARATDKLRRRLEEFQQCLLSLGSTESEVDREGIRRAGVNLFVSLEDFLERLVSFNCWFSSADHFLVTRFTYNRDAAVRLVAMILGKVVQCNGVELAWKPSGENTLGVIVAYLNRLVEWLSDRRDVDKSGLRRSVDELPHYAELPSQEFPFVHREAWADFDRNEFDVYLGWLQDVAGQIGRSSVAEVRNGLDHKRTEDRFPSLETMLAMTSRVREAVDLADIHRLIPKRYWLEKDEIDVYGRGNFVLQDYADRRTTIVTPMPVISMPTVSFSSPVVLGPGTLLAGGTVPYIFTVQSSNEYSRYWDGYPRRRQIPPTKTTVHDAQLRDSETEPAAPA